MKTLQNKYLELLNGYSHKDIKYKGEFIGEDRLSLINSVKFLDIILRECIGKTDNIQIALCSHQSIINREFPIHFCRICNKDLSGNIARCNDFLVLRHPQCLKPICLNCVKNNPDEFFLAFKRGLDKYQSLGHDGRIGMHLTMELKELNKIWGFDK